MVNLLLIVHNALLSSPLFYYNRGWLLFPALSMPVALEAIMQVNIVSSPRRRSESVANAHGKRPRPGDQQQQNHQKKKEDSAKTIEDTDSAEQYHHKQQQEQQQHHLAEPLLLTGVQEAETIFMMNPHRLSSHSGGPKTPMEMSPRSSAAALLSDISDENCNPN
eukprot:TRINITY_DN22330_c0_g2_i2.p2 TRINITY_DN22330_c0_g2~~TRINITY_DN22330_c0_g2_i2.p2  ORF type:complete len:164 (+),score=35.35 TRINITY_DN22330_c0_g2_i2:799-1290(+)